MNTLQNKEEKLPDDVQKRFEEEFVDNKLRWREQYHSYDTNDNAYTCLIDAPGHYGVAPKLAGFIGKELASQKKQLLSRVLEEVDSLAKGPLYFTPDASEAERLAGNVSYNQALNSVRKALTTMMEETI
jgi:hypothetical protein